MALVKLEIDGKRIIADGNQTILQVARQHGIETIPTLCDDAQLEPFASCFVCVVKVKGARSLLPACSTKVANGMVVDTNSTEVRQSRRAALELLLSDHYADCVGPCQIACPASVDIQGYVALAAIGPLHAGTALFPVQDLAEEGMAAVTVDNFKYASYRLDLLERRIRDLPLAAGGPGELVVLDSMQWQMDQAAGVRPGAGRRGPKTATECSSGSTRATCITCIVRAGSATSGCGAARGTCPARA